MLQSNGSNTSTTGSLHVVRLVFRMLPGGHVRHLRCPVAGCQLRPVLQAAHFAGPAVALAVPAHQEGVADKDLMTISALVHCSLSSMPACLLTLTVAQYCIAARLHYSNEQACA